MDSFELFIFKLIPINWWLATVAARLIISLELGIGLFYLLGIKLRQTNFLSLIVISGFSVWLLIQWLGGNTENCQCFGDVIQFSPGESLIKNGIILILIFLLFKIDQGDLFIIPQKIRKAVAWSAFLLAILLPVIISPPDFLFANRYSIKGVSKTIDLTKIDTFPWKNPTLSMDLTTGHDMVVFMSMKCKICKKAAKKVSIFNKQHDDSLHIYYVFFGDTVNLPTFWEESGSTKFPYKIIPSYVFFSYTMQLPTAFLLKDGKVIQTASYRELDDRMIDDWLK